MEQSRTAIGRGSLPVELTQFIGRQAELSALRQLLAGSRLLTLTGAGGSGKSRLALELAPQLRAIAPDGVAWVELAPLTDAELIAGEVLRAIGAPGEGGAATAESVATVLHDRQAALVLDNCEHLVEACAAFVADLLRRCPQLRVLATSREALGIAGERAWLVPPLEVPDADADLGTLQTSDAVRLFADRARDVLPGFAITQQNATVVASICARLDGIPLALELAAARIRHMAPEQILERLSDAFALLTTGARSAMPRHRTLRATLDWSHDLLPADARAVLRRLAVFRGGFTLDAVEAVATGDDIAAGDVLDLVAVLADRSMIFVREQHALARYQLLETMRQYAAQRLREADEETVVRRRHADYLTDLVAELEPAFITTARRSAFNLLEPELDNIREVLHWTRAHEPEQHVRLVGMLWWFWFSTRHWVEAHRWITDALAMPEAAGQKRERAALLFAGGALASLRAQVAEAQPLLEAAAALAAELGDDRLEAYALNYLGMVYAQQGRVEAREYSGKAERWFRAHDDLYGLRLALLLVGMAERAAGNHDDAMRMTREAVDIARRFGQDRELAVALQNMVLMLLDEGDNQAATPLILEALSALRRDPSYLFIYRGIEYLAVTVSPVDPREAARMIGAAEAVRLHIGANRFRMDQNRIDDLVPTLRARIGDADYEAAFGAGLALSATEALDDVIRRHDTGESAVATPSSATPPAAEAATAVTSAGRSSEAEAPTRALPAVPADLTVRALGAFETAVAGVPVDSWPYTKPKELLVYLLSQPQGRTRVEIGQAIWPDAAPSQVRNSFHVTLHHLRKTLGHSDWIVIEQDRYRIAPRLVVDFDVRVFEAEIRAGLATRDGQDSGGAMAALRRGMALYRDHFLAGEAAGGWRDEVQDRLRRLYCDAGLHLADLLAEGGDMMAAAEACELVIAQEPLHEEAHRGLMLAWTRAGRRAHALRHYDRFTSVLLRELDMEPEPETVELYERIRAADIVPHA
ncbi:hypothetical protein BH23GEM9_BH23GEM9_32210 [soil metagenome]